MRTTPGDNEDFAYLSAMAREAHEHGATHFVHLDQPVGRWNYIRIANEITARVPRGRVLDWGCGFGQMTWLLRRRGFDVTPFDVGAPNPSLSLLSMSRDLEIVRADHPTRLPFESAGFDAVLSCGVLEHVDEFSAPGNERESVLEIARVLRPGGHFLVYQLPQRFAWQEAVMRWWNVGYWHPRRFSEPEIRTLLAQAGFTVERVARNNLFPKNLTGLPEPVRRLYSRFARALIDLDSALSATPALNRLAGVLELVARRRSD